MTHRTCLKISLLAGAISVLFAMLSFAFAHGSPTVGTIVFCFLKPSLLLADVFGIETTLSPSLYIFVFFVQFLAAYAVSVLAGYVWRRFSGTSDRNTSLR
jgi:hypothetical protein